MCLKNVILMSFCYYVKPLDIKLKSLNKLHKSGKRYPSEIPGTFFYILRKVDLMKTVKVNTYIVHIFGKIELLSILAT